MLSREFSGAYKGTHKNRLPPFDTFDQDKLRIAVVETYTTRSVRKAEPCGYTSDYLHRSAGNCSLPIDTWIPVGGKRTRDIRVLCSGLGSGSANSDDAERGEERF